MGALSKSAKAESRLDICPPAYLICLASNVMRKRTRCGRIASIFFVDRSERDSSSKARNDIEFTAGSICYGLLATSRKPERGARGGAHREKLWCELDQETILAEILDLLDMLSRGFVVFRVGEIIGKGLWEK